MFIDCGCVHSRKCSRDAHGPTKLKIFTVCPFMESLPAPVLEAHLEIVLWSLDSNANLLKKHRIEEHAIHHHGAKASQTQMGGSTGKYFFNEYYKRKKRWEG